MTKKDSFEYSTVFYDNDFRSALDKSIEEAKKYIVFNRSLDIPTISIEHYLYIKDGIKVSDPDVKVLVFKVGNDSLHYKVTESILFSKSKINYANVKFEEI